MPGTPDGAADDNADVASTGAAPVGPTIPAAPPPPPVDGMRLGEVAGVPKFAPAVLAIDCEGAIDPDKFDEGAGNCPGMLLVSPPISAGTELRDAIDGD